MACSPLSLIPGSSSPPTDGVVPADAQEVVEGIQALCCEDGWWQMLSEAESEASNADEDAGVVFLENMEAAGMKFDADQYFTVLTHLAPAEGYVLDYVYFAPGGDGWPYLYGRREGEAGYKNAAAYKDDGYPSYEDHLQTDGTPEGFYELVVLSIMGEQFYLSWHGNYNDREVVASRERLEAIIAEMNEEHNPFTEEQEKAIRELDVDPRVEIKRNKVLVRVLVFTKWGGFFERVYTFDKEFPHEMAEDERELVPYDCGMMF